jgi:hypothetical protein
LEKSESWSEWIQPASKGVETFTLLTISTVHLNWVYPVLSKKSCHVIGMVKFPDKRFEVDRENPLCIIFLVLRLGLKEHDKPSDCEHMKTQAEHRKTRQEATFCESFRLQNRRSTHQFSECQGQWFNEIGGAERKFQ